MSGHSPASIHLAVTLNQEACFNSSGVGDSNTRPAGIYFAAGMIRQIYSIKPEDAATVRSSKLLAKLELEDIDLILRERRLRWFRNVERSSCAIRTACDIQINDRRRAGRPKLTWKKTTERDCCEWKLTTVDHQERSTWSSGVRSAMRAAGQLPGKGPTDVDDAPAPAR